MKVKYISKGVLHNEQPKYTSSGRIMRLVLVFILKDIQITLSVQKDSVSSSIKTAGFIGILRYTLWLSLYNVTVSLG